MSTASLPLSGLRPLRSLQLTALLPSPRPSFRSNALFEARSWLHHRDPADVGDACHGKTEGRAGACAGV